MPLRAKAHATAGRYAQVMRDLFRDMSGWMRLWVVLSAAWVVAGVALASSVRSGFDLSGFLFMTFPLGLLWGIAWIAAGFRQQRKTQG